MKDNSTDQLRMTSEMVKAVYETSSTSTLISVLLRRSEAENEPLPDCDMQRLIKIYQNFENKMLAEIMKKTG